MAYEVDAVVGCSVALCGERRLCSDAVFCNQALEGGPDRRVGVAETRQDVGGCVLDRFVKGL